MLTNIHCHSSLFAPNQNKVYSILLHPETDIVKLMLAVPSQLYVSIGAHPWHALEWAGSNRDQLTAQLDSKRITMIGEIGLDRACGIPLDIQLELFTEQLQIADEKKLSVLIHLVGHQDVMIALKRKYSRIPAWIIHGFRGKESEARQFLSHGFHLSFGPKFNLEALRACPLERMFLETDESSIDIRMLYEIVAKELSLSENELEENIQKNFDTIRKK